MKCAALEKVATLGTRHYPSLDLTMQPLQVMDGGMGEMSNKGRCPQTMTT